MVFICHIKDRTNELKNKYVLEQLENIKRFYVGQVIHAEINRRSETYMHLKVLSVSNDKIEFKRFYNKSAE